MNYKIYVYVICVLLCSFGLSGLNFDSFMKKNKPLEARILVVVLSCVTGYLLANFIFDFINVSKVF